MARRAMDHLAAAGLRPFKISVVVTRHNVAELDGFEALADGYGAQLRLTRLRPSGRGADTWDELHPSADQQRDLYHWLLDRPDVLTGDSFFHLSALGESLPGLNLCGAGRVVCLIDPVGDVYACPFVLHDEFRAGSVRDAGGFAHVWRQLRAVPSLREPQSRRRLRVAAAATTPARAAAWPPSSSPACPSTAPTPSACTATASGRWPASPPARRPGRPGPLVPVPSACPSPAGRPSARRRPPPRRRARAVG